MLLNEKTNFKSIKVNDRVKQEIEKLKEKKGKIIVKDVKRVIELIYIRKNPDHLTEDIIDIFEVIRLSIIVGLPFLINPILGILAWLIDRIIKEKVEEKHKNFYINKYKREISYIEKKLENKNLSKKEKEALKDLKTKLESDLSKLEDYFYQIEKYKDKEENNDNEDE